MLYPLNTLQLGKALESLPTKDGSPAIHKRSNPVTLRLVATCTYIHSLKYRSTFSYFLLSFTAHLVLKVCRTPGPTAYSTSTTETGHILY